jgi:molecular chaperone GrpE
MSNEQNPTEEQVIETTEKEVEATAEPTTDTMTLEVSAFKELNHKLEEATKKADEWKNDSLRARADLENARRRFDIQSAENKKFASEGTLKAFLPIIDDLDNAINHTENTADGKANALLDGIKLVQRKFLQVCENQGASSFYPLGEAFDPTLHEALTEMPSADYEAGKIAQVFQRGWKLHDRLLRPAKVIISKG